MSKLRLLLPSILATAVLLEPARSEAFCGFYVSGADARLTNNATSVVLMREGTRTVLSMQNNYQGPPQDFAMVVPVPVILQEKDVKTLGKAVFDRIDQLAAPRLVEYWEQDPCPPPEPRRRYKRGVKYAMESAPMMDEMRGPADYGVRIEAKFEVGEYQILILSAEYSSGLDAWLRQNNYKIPAGAAEVLRPYVAAGMKFFVAKVDVKKVQFNAQGQAMLSPLRFHYDSDTFALPVRLGLLNASGKQDLIVHILAKGDRYELANYRNAAIPTNIEVADSTRHNFPAFYASMFDRVLERHPGAIVTEYAWQANNCDPCPVPPLDSSELTVLGADVSPVPNPSPNPGEYVLTRLHARYGAENLGEDLVFRAGPPIVGGRETGGLFIEHARDLAGRGGLHVLVVAPPNEVFSLGSSGAQDPDAHLDEGQDERVSYVSNFHDIFKARGLDLACPCQLLRPDTYGGGPTKSAGRRSRRLPDKATRAWNFHTALYYKAGGVPWRLVRQSAGLTTCYVGASFFKSIQGDRLLTSVAQVFNERGEGLIVQGGNARIDRRDRSPHLSAEDARKLLAGGLASYRREHRTMPARVLVHKTSYFDEEEIAGCREAAREERVEILDLVSVRRAGVRLLPAAVPAVRRGTALVYDDRAGLVYLKGTVPYFRTYPGPYLPRALEFTRDEGEGVPLDLARELLELSKLNFNNTQFDSGDPITVRAARRVGDILKHVSPDRVIHSRFRYFT